LFNSKGDNPHAPGPVVNRDISAMTWQQ